MFAKLKTAWDSDLVWSWRHSPVAIAATIMALLLFIGALGARWVAPYDPFDLTSIDLMDALLAPAWMGTSPFFILLFYWNFRRTPLELFEAARLEEEHQIAPAAAAGVQDLAAGREAAFQDLVEEIDVDRPDHLAQAVESEGGGGSVHHAPIL